MATGEYLYANQAATVSQGYIFYDGSTHLYVNQLSNNSLNLSYLLNSTLDPKSLVFITTNGNAGYGFSVNAGTVVNGTQVVIPVTELASNPPLPVAGSFVSLNVVNSLTVEGLSDTNITSPTNGQVLQWSTSTSKWVNGAGGGGGGGTVTDISEVVGQIVCSPNPIVASGTIGLANAGTAGTYTNPSSVSTDAFGRVIAITSGSGPGTGTVTSVSQGMGIICSPNPIVNTGSVSLDTQTLTTIIWMEGATSLNPNVFTGDSNLLNGYISANPGLLEIYVDNSFAVPDISVQLDCQFRVALYGRGTGTDGSPYEVVSISAGGAIVNAFSVQYLTVNGSGSSDGSLFVFEANNGNQNLTLENFRVQQSNDFPIFSVVAGTTSTNQVIVLKQGSIQANNSTLPAFQVLDGGSNLTVAMANLNQTWNDITAVFGGVSPSSITLLADSNNYGTNFPASTQPLVLGLFNLVLSAVAVRTSYDDSTPPSIGSTVQAALDTLKAGAGGSSSINPDFGAFAAGQVTQYNGNTSHFGNPPNSQLIFTYQYDSSSTTTPAAGKFSVVNGSPNIIYINQLDIVGVNNSGFLTSIPAKNYIGCLLNPFNLLNFLSNGTLVGSVVNFQEDNLSAADIPNNTYVTFTIVFPNTFYKDQSGNISSNNNSSITGQNNTLVASSGNSSTVIGGNNNSVYGEGALATPSVTITGDGITAIGAAALGASSGIGVSNLTAIGFQALQNFNSGLTSTAVGANALQNDSGGANIAFGENAFANATFSGSNNIGIGINVGNLLSSGSFNTLVGSGANAPTSSNSVVAIGYQSGSSGSAVANCVVVGSNASTGASNNVVIGNSADSNSSNDNNVVVGADASTEFGDSVVIGSGAKGFATGVVSIGYQAMFNAAATTNTSTGVGFQTLFGESGTGGNTAIGAQVLSNAALTGNSNCGVGRRALFGNTSGSNNVGVGFGAGTGITTGGNNTGVGTNCLASITTVSNCVAVGESAMASYAGTLQSTAVGTTALQFCSGNSCTAIGGLVLSANPNSGSNNVGVGENCCASNSSGSNNTACGQNALSSNTTGSDNAVFGQNALSSCTVSTENVVIGSNNAPVLASALSDSVIIGYKNAVVLNPGTAVSDLILIGQQNLESATSIGANVICIGSASMTSQTSGAANCIVLGSNSMNANTDTDVICIGNSSLGVGSHSLSIVIGNNILDITPGTETAPECVLIGYGIQNNVSAGVNDANVLIGTNVAPNMQSSGNVIIGHNACQASGAGAFTGVSNNVVLGLESDVGASGVSESVAVGTSCNLLHVQSIALGASCQTGGANSFNLNRVTTNTTASAGTGATLPVTVDTYLQIFINNTEYRIPMYLP